MWPRVCLKIHSDNLHAPLCGIFAPNSVNVARYASLIRVKDAQLLAEKQFLNTQSPGTRRRIWTGIQKYFCEEYPLGWE